MQGRRTRSDSVQSAVSAFVTARRQIDWPDEITRLPRPEDSARSDAIFRRACEARAIDDFRSADVLLLAQYANVTSQLDRITQEIEVVGWVIPSPKNPDQMVRNPLLDAASLIGQRQLSLARSLGLSGLPADSKTVAKNARLATDAIGTVARYQEDDSLGLLA